MCPPPDTPVLMVLLVDDNLINRRLGSLMLERLGCAVTAVDDGPAAIERVARERFDLVLMDLRMPGMDGLDTARQIRSAGATMPILAVTAGAVDGERTACAAAGMDGLLVKPLRLEALRDVVEEVAAQR